MSQWLFLLWLIHISKCHDFGANIEIEGKEDDPWTVGDALGNPFFYRVNPASQTFKDYYWYTREQHAVYKHTAGLKWIEYKAFHSNNWNGHGFDYAEKTNVIVTLDASNKFNGLQDDSVPNKQRLANDVPPFGLPLAIAVTRPNNYYHIPDYIFDTKVSQFSDHSFKDFEIVKKKKMLSFLTKKKSKSKKSTVKSLPEIHPIAPNHCMYVATWQIVRHLDPTLVSKWSKHNWNTHVDQLMAITSALYNKEIKMENGQYGAYRTKEMETGAFSDDFVQIKLNEVGLEFEPCEYVQEEKPFEDVDGASAALKKFEYTYIYRWERVELMWGILPRPGFQKEFETFDIFDKQMFSRFKTDIVGIILGVGTYGDYFNHGTAFYKKSDGSWMYTDTNVHDTKTLPIGKWPGDKQMHEWIGERKNNWKNWFPVTNKYNGKPKKGYQVGMTINLGKDDTVAAHWLYYKMFYLPQKIGGAFHFYIIKKKKKPIIKKKLQKTMKKPKKKITK
eukprot:97127_1